MTYRKKNTRLHPEQKRTEREGIGIKRGIFQGDSSPMLFCVSSISFRQQLNKLKTAYSEHTTKTKISSLLYTDDLKLTGKTEQKLQKQLQKS
jgi:hypothetical protein